jgi:hypothetical protein
VKIRTEDSSASARYCVFVRALLLLLAACGQPTARPPVAPIETRPHAPSHAPSSAPAAPAIAPAAIKDGTILPPGCTADEAKARLAELEKVNELIHNNGADPAVILDQLRAAIAKPCLRHNAPAIGLPAATTLEALRYAWSYGMAGALDAATEIKIRDGLELLVIPSEPVRASTATERQALAAFLCTNNDPACTRARAYILRAEEAFDARLSSDDLPVETCTSWIRDEEDRPKSFEEWVACVGWKARRNHRYLADVALRAPERGWLILRGRRGHYDFADEIRAYDLATGAAYVVADHGVIIQTGPIQGPDAYTGTVAAEHIRELAFYLLTRAAIVETRTRTQYAVIPPALPRTLGSGKYSGETDWGRVVVSDSGQTSIAWTYFDGATRANGTFTWPDDYEWLDSHTDALVRVMEAGLVKGCAPAKLPSKAELAGKIGGVSVIDADPYSRAGTFAELEKRLDGLRAKACRKP